jgi:hypothetical protein
MTDDQLEISPRAEVLREAERLITGDRNETYGTPTQNFTNIADLWNVQFRHLLAPGKEFSAADVALAQIHVKMARTITQPKRDNFVDLAGYAACGWECVPGEAQPDDDKQSEPEALTGVVRPSPGVYTINVSSSADPGETAAMIRAAMKTVVPPGKDSPHECGPAC